MSISKFDFSEGSFVADFYMTLESDSTFSENLDLMNGQELSKEVMENNPNRKVIRYKVLCNENLDYSRFPLDKHSLSIQFEDKLLNTDSLKFVIEPKLSGIDSQVGIIGWNLSEKIQHILQDHFYPNFNENYSRVTFVIKLNKPMLASFFKSVLPCVIMIFVVFLLYFMNPMDAKDRVNAMASLLIANVLLHLSSTGDLPPLSYLTIQDKLMLTNYAVVLSSILVSMILMYKAKNGETEAVFKINRRAQFILYPSYIIIQTLIIWMS